MKRTMLESLVTEKSLSLVNGADHSFLIDAVVDDADVFQTKNVCAKLSVQLSDEIDSIVGLLGISKRRFIEACFVDAVEKAHEIIEIEGVSDALGERAASYVSETK